MFEAIKLLKKDINLFIENLLIKFKNISELKKNY